MSHPISKILREIEKYVPSGTAEEWDNVGLLAGDPDWKTTGAVISVDLTEETIALAAKKGFRLIVNHHPCIFPRSRGLARLVAGPKSSSNLIFQALTQGIAVAAYHTNFDRCALEVVEDICRHLKMEPRGRFIERPREKLRTSLMKLVVFVPVTHADSVKKAICEAGAGQIGRYDFCTFSGSGEGTFRGGKGTKPFLGKSGQLEKAKELRLETVFPRGMEKPILKAMSKAHPYEEVAYDLYALEQEPNAAGMAMGLGYGVWGDFPTAKPFPELEQSVKSLFKIDGFWLTGRTPRSVKRIGFVAGKGASFIGAAIAAECDLFITGEAGYHSALEGSRKGMPVMELGHRESERLFLKTMGKWLASLGLKTAELDVPTQKIWFGGKSK